MASDEDWLKQLDQLAATVSKGESRDRGALQGITGGWSDELAAGVDTAASKVPFLRNLAQVAHDPRFPPITNPDVPYAQRRDAYRAANQAAAQGNPTDYGRNLIGGGVAQSAMPGVGLGKAIGPIGAGAVTGAATGAGLSDASGGQLVKDTIKGAGVGALTGWAARNFDRFAQEATAREAVALRRDIAGPEAGSGKASDLARKRVYELGEDVNQAVAKAPPELKDAIRTKDARTMGKLADARVAALSERSKAIYGEAVSKSEAGGFSLADATAPLEDLTKRLRASGQVEEAAAVEKTLADNVRTGLFARDPKTGMMQSAADPIQVRDFITKLMKQSETRMQTPEYQAAGIADRKVAAVLRGQLNDWVERTAGPKLAEELRDNNKQVAAMSAISDAAAQAGYVAELGKAPTIMSNWQGVRNAIQDAARPAQRAINSPAGQQLLHDAAKAASGLPPRLLDAMVNKDDDAAKKAISDDVFGGAQ